MNHSRKTKNYLALAMMALPMLGFSQEQTTTVFSNALFNVMLGVVIFLLIVIIALSQVLKNLSQSDTFINMIRGNEEKKNNSGKTLGIVLLSMLALNASAEGGASAAGWLVGGLKMSTFFAMLGIILVELMIIAALFVTLKSILKKAAPVSEEVLSAKKESNILDQFNASVSIEKEAEIMMDHDYDGIKELDNDLPPWWKYGFYLTIVFAFIYLVHYHISGTGDLQLAEYNKEIEKGKAEVAEHMKLAANNVDENTVKLLTGADLDAGKQAFINVCAACHGRAGEGGVGPNLTDDYWVHGGSLVDIFKSIKYGWPDKGMKSWKEDLSPMQIAQVTSFIKSLRGTNPPNGKAPQGDLYTENANAAPADSSAAAVADSLQVLPKSDSSAKVPAGK